MFHLLSNFCKITKNSTKKVFPQTTHFPHELISIIVVAICITALHIVPSGLGHRLPLAKGESEKITPHWDEVSGIVEKDIGDNAGNYS